MMTIYQVFNQLSIGLKGLQKSYLYYTLTYCAWIQMTPSAQCEEVGDVMYQVSGVAKCRQRVTSGLLHNMLFWRSFSYINMLIKYSEFVLH